MWVGTVVVIPGDEVRGTRDGAKRVSVRPTSGRPRTDDRPGGDRVAVPSGRHRRLVTGSPHHRPGDPTTTTTSSTGTPGSVGPRSRRATGTPAAPDPTTHPRRRLRVRPPIRGAPRPGVRPSRPSRGPSYQRARRSLSPTTTGRTVGPATRPTSLVGRPVPGPSGPPTA